MESLLNMGPVCCEYFMKNRAMSLTLMAGFLVCRVLDLGWK